ncbi:hypothetical protein [Nocardioides pocheonensis]|uniref:DUF3558 domain-containing protein n=1 Tax=Nocardioides pocheonensis TaxID=661485 RepID=A0A3N0GMH1_9ACTN|nr:hypothetical protein [Nocardioides pocheonensis]RNM13647.1 hypothetical protein EFL26_11660 [Nocardioides pocheonensis]
MRRGPALLAAACALAAPLLVACSGSDRPTAVRTSAPTPISRLDATQVRVAKAGFCDRVPASAVRRALDGTPQSHDAWANGDPIPAATGSGDVGHEIGCSWTGADGSTARAWVFARSVTTDFAGTLVAQAGKQQGCTAEAAKVFGSPALLQTCPQPGGLERLRRAGLFGDSWLTCELTAPASGPQASRRARLDDWCGAVVAALRVA